MVRSKAFRWLGGLMILAGLTVLGFAAYTYIENGQAEAYAEAHVPGQLAASPVQTVPASPAPPSLLPDLSENDATPPTLVAPPTQAPLPTLASSGGTATPRMTVGPEGLPKGKGANAVRIVIPRLKLDAQVDQATWTSVDEGGQQVSEWYIPFDAAGHLSTTAEPGEVGNAVLSGHHNLIGPNKFGLGLFAGMWNLQMGDSIYVFDTIGRIFQFRVTQGFPLKELDEPLAVREQHAQQVLQDTPTPELTLETCWNGPQAPLSGNTYRWIIRSQLVGTVDLGQVPNVKG